MSRDRYSDSHTVEVLRNRNFSIETEHYTSGGDIRLITKGDSGHIYLITGEPGESGGSIFLRNNGDDGEIVLESESAGVRLKSGMNMTFDSGLKLLNSKTWIRSRGGGGMKLESSSLGAPFEIWSGGDLNGSILMGMNFQADQDISFTSTQSDILLTAEDEVRILAESEALSLSGHGIILDATGDLNYINNGHLEMYAKNTIYLKSEEGPNDPNTGQPISGLEDQGKIILEPHPDNCVEIEGDLKVNGTIDGIITGGLPQEVDLSRINAGDQGFFGVPGRLVIQGAPVGGYGQGNPNTTSVHRYVLQVENWNPTPDSADGINIMLNAINQGTPYANSTNNWMTFQWGGGGSSSYVAGAVQGAGGTNPIPGQMFPWGLANTYTGGVNDAVGHDGLIPGTLATYTGMAQYVSGGADFGEFFEIGNVEEWDPKWRHREEDGPIYGLIEGIVVYVVGNKFFKNPQDGVGVPMLVTNRSLIVGSGTPLLKGSRDNRKGEVLSFMGQLPVFVKGRVNTGDLIIPSDSENICLGLPKEDADFQSYMKALGTALSSCPEEATLPEDHPASPGEKVSFHSILCAVGVK